MLHFIQLKQDIEYFISSCNVVPTAEANLFERGIGLAEASYTGGSKQGLIALLASLTQSPSTKTKIIVLCGPFVAINQTRTCLRS